MASLLHALLSLCLALLLLASPAGAARESDSYDGNIYALYAGNGSSFPAYNTL